MKNRVYTPKKENLVTLREICKKGKIPFPIMNENSIYIEIVCNQKEDIVRNFPKKSYSIKTEDPQEIIELLAYEAHKWQSYEIQRTNVKHKFPLLT